MYNKLKELCAALSKMTAEELHNNGLEAIIIFGISSKLQGFEFSKGDLPYVLSMLGAGIAATSKKSGIPLKDLLDDIYENETILGNLREKAEEQRREEGE